MIVAVMEREETYDLPGIVDGNCSSVTCAEHINGAKGPANVEETVFSLAVIEGSDDLPGVVYSICGSGVRARNINDSPFLAARCRSVMVMALTTRKCRLSSN